jgi:hypothetical protein
LFAAGIVELSLEVKAGFDLGAAALGEGFGFVERRALDFAQGDLINRTAEQLEFYLVPAAELLVLEYEPTPETLGVVE